MKNRKKKEQMAQDRSGHRAPQERPPGRTGAASRRHRAPTRQRPPTSQTQPFSSLSSLLYLTFSKKRKIGPPQSPGPIFLFLEKPFLPLS